MTAFSVAELPNGFAIEIRGADATKVINNLCTNDIARLQEGRVAESFVTDLRGWVVAHGVVVKRPNWILLLGSHPQPENITNHVDRYIIREDAQVGNLTPQKNVLLLDGADADAWLGQLCGQELSDQEDVWDLSLEGSAVLAARLPITGPQAIGLVCDREQSTGVREHLVAAGCQALSVEEFQFRRIANGWPLSPADIRDKTIPQELDRDKTAISFTKGCYLGQETIARLDARGQLQKKLCVLETRQQDSGLQPADSVMQGDKEIGQLTSLAAAPSQNRTLALGFLKRGNFEPGTELRCQNVALRVL